MTPATFKKTIWDFYAKNKRDLPWRRTRDPYKILVSEIMLQQTQVARVEVKYISFLKKFPTTEALAAAKLSDVLKEWQGLGYNRRAVYLKKCAEKVVTDPVLRGKFPRNFAALCELPGIGPATAGDIMAFAWNIPVPVIETNIRSVYIHFFFMDRFPKDADGNVLEKGKLCDKINDREILPIIEKTLDHENPREWYWALFDYGAHIKKTHKNPSRRSAHHVKQTRFEGSYRQKRAEVLRVILKNSDEAGKTQTEILKEVSEKIVCTDETLAQILIDLEREGFIKSVQKNFKKGTQQKADTNTLYIPA